MYTFCANHFSSHTIYPTQIVLSLDSVYLYLSCSQDILEVCKVKQSSIPVLAPDSAPFDAAMVTEGDTLDPRLRSWQLAMKARKRGQQQLAGKTLKYHLVQKTEQNRT